MTLSPHKDTEIKRTIFCSPKDMGGVYFKCLQVLSITHKFLEGWAGPAEMSVFNDVPTEPIDLSDHLNLSNFCHINHVPIAAGSFAQVYQATLHSGDSVAIKILHPNIANNLKRDLKHLKRLSIIFSKFLPNSIINYKQIIAEFSTICLTETDYTREIANMEYFAKYYTGHPYVIIPRVYKDLSTPTVIVQEFIPGPTFADCLTAVTPNHPATQIAKELTGSDLWTQLVIGGGEAIRMAITSDFVFGDPHPGNIKLLPDNKIAFIGFGIIAPKPTSHAPFTSTIAEAVTAKFDSMKSTDNLVQDLSQNGHFFRLFTHALDNNNALGLALDTRNFALITSPTLNSPAYQPISPPNPDTPEATLSPS